MTNHCTHEQSKALKEIGFDMPVRDYIYTANTGNNTDTVCMTMKVFNHNSETDCVSLPTHAEALDWFREKKGIDGWVMPMLKELNGYLFCYEGPESTETYTSRSYPTHPEATSALVDKCIEITKKQKA